MTDVGVGLLVGGAGLAVVAIAFALLAYKLSDAKDDANAAQVKQVLAERDLAIANFKLAQVEAELDRETTIEKVQDKEIGDAINTKPNADLAADDVDTRIKRLFASWRASPPTSASTGATGPGPVPSTSPAAPAGTAPR